MNISTDYVLICLLKKTQLLSCSDLNGQMNFMFDFNLEQQHLCLISQKQHFIQYLLRFISNISVISKMSNKLPILSDFYFIYSSMQGQLLFIQSSYKFIIISQKCETFSILKLSFLYFRNIQQLIMGNNSSIFCKGLIPTKETINTNQSDEYDSHDENNQKQLQSLEVNSIIPFVNQEVSDILTLMKPLKHQLSEIKKPNIIYYRGHIFWGEISDDFPKVPNGYGKLYLSDKSLLIAKFQNGNPIHEFFFIKANGNYCYGFLQNNSKDYQNCVYHQEKQFEYNGTIKDKLLEGNGTLFKKDYQLQGHFKNSKLRKGRLTWNYKNQKLVYSGQFDQNMQFHGKGILQDQNGIYEGRFQHNLKSEKGKYTYTYTNQNYYIGSYKNDIKNGYGVLFSRQGELLYDGQWCDGLPKQQIVMIQRVLSRKSLIKVKSLEKISLWRLI